MASSDVRLNYILGIRYIDCTNKEPALHQAVINNDLEVLQLFIECKTDINIADRHGKLPIAYVKQESQLKVLELLLAAGSNIYQLDQLGMMQFSTAFRSGHSTVIETYLLEKINLNMPDANGQTAIHYLMDNSHIDFLTYIEILQRRDCNVDVEDLNGQTPLLLAIKNKNLKNVKFLLQKTTNVDYVFERQSSPIYGLIRYFCDDSGTHERLQEYNEFTIECLGLLIAGGADVNSVLYGSYTILKLALKVFDYKIVEAILRKLALLEISGSLIIEINRKTIEQYPKVKSHYSEMISELKRMMEVKLYQKVSFFNILFEENIDTIAKYFKNLKLPKVFHSIDKKFPNYYPIVYDKCIEGYDRMHQIVKIEEMLSEIFYLNLPPHVISKIAVCCLD